MTWLPWFTPNCPLPVLVVLKFVLPLPPRPRQLCKLRASSRNRRAERQLRCCFIILPRTYHHTRTASGDSKTTRNSRSRRLCMPSQSLLPLLRLIVLMFTICPAVGSTPLPAVWATAFVPGDACVDASEDVLPLAAILQLAFAVEPNILVITGTMGAQSGNTTDCPFGPIPACE